MARSGSRKPRARRADEAQAKAEATALPEVLQFMRLLWAVVHALQMRSVLVLTPKGVKVNARGKGTVERAVQVTLEQVAASDLAATEDVLSRLAACLGDPKRR